MKLQIQERTFHTIEIIVEAKPRVFKIPSELSVSEIERLLEYQIKLEALQEEPVKDTGSSQVRLYWQYVFCQLEVIFRHYHPELTREYLQDNIMPQDALRILGFFADNRYVEKSTESDKKKLN